MRRREFLAAGASLASVAAVGGCASSVSEGAGAFDWTARPQRGGITPEEHARMRGLIQTEIEADRLMGVVTSVANRDGVLVLDAQGRCDAETGAPMPDDGIYRMMSSTKPMTAVAALTLVNEGRLSIDDPVSRYIPSFANPRVAIAPDGWQQARADPARRAAMAERVRFVPAEREITIKDLLTHTSGLATDGPASLVNPSEFPAPGATLASHIPSIGGFALNFQPGERWSYSAIAAMDTVLRVIEVITGQDIESYMRQRIFDPLGMRDTHFRLPREKQHRLLKVYRKANNTWQEETPRFSNDENTTYCSGGGGLLSTVRDFIAFEMMLLNDGEFNGARVLRPEMVALLKANHAGAQFASGFPPYSNGMGFGLGVAVVLDPDVSIAARGRGAFGWGGAYGTESWADPELGCVCCYFMQQLPPRPSVPEWAELVRAAMR